MEELNKRVDRLERQKDQELLALVEILANATFFGELKKANCEFAKDGQCSYFKIKKDSKNRIPIVTSCRLKDCKQASSHCHIELSNLTCTLCQQCTMNTKQGLEHPK